MEVFIGVLDVQKKHVWNYSNTSLRKHAHMIYSNFFMAKIDNFQRKFFDIFLIFAQNIDCVYTLEPPRRGGNISRKCFPDVKVSFLTLPNAVSVT